MFVCFFSPSHIPLTKWSVPEHFCAKAIYSLSVWCECFRLNYLNNLENSPICQYIKQGYIWDKQSFFCQFRFDQSLLISLSPHISPLLTKRKVTVRVSVCLCSVPIRLVSSIYVPLDSNKNKSTQITDYESDCFET